MTLTDSRRLTGPNLHLDGPGAAAEIAVADTVKAQAIALWGEHVCRLLTSIGWPDEQIITRVYDGGATLAITAPIDGLYAATEVVEAAWEFALAQINGSPLPDFDAAVDNLKREIADEHDPALIILSEAAKTQGVSCIADDEWVTLGVGVGSQTWPHDKLPSPEMVDWTAITDAPVAFVTGTNGKSTTVRIAASIGAAANRTIGFSTSDWVKVGEEEIATGDYSGPEGARLAMRDPRVDMAIIETARGGLLRRGLPLPQTTACLITNVAADHLGEYGIHDVEALADTKFTVSKAVEHSGLLILNADDERLLSRGQDFGGRVAWYGLSLGPSDVPLEGFAAFIQDDHFAIAKDGKVTLISSVNDFAPALDGAAAYNVSNALGAILLMRVLGVDNDDIRAGLSNFESTVEDNPGRGNFMEIGGVKVLLDFAHNPHGLLALTDALNNVPAKRRLYLCGQGGDRSNEDIYQMTKVIRESEPDAIIVKEIKTKLRGRELGELPALIRQYLADMDYTGDQVIDAASELDAVIKAFEWAKPDDLLVLLIHANREKALALLQKLQEENWRPGDVVSL